MNRDKKVAEEIQLDHKKEFYRQIVETTNEGIWVIDGEGRTSYANQRMAEMLGCRLNELMGRSAFDFVFPEDRAKGETEFDLCKIDSGGRQIQFRYRKNDGTELWALVSSSVLIGSDGGAEGILGMFTDITEFKRTQEELQELNRTLLHRVDRRTMKLQESEERRTRLAVDLVSAHDEEQRRISEGLHDHILQLLAAVKMKQGLLGTNRKNPEEAELLQDITELLNETIEKIRSLSFELKTSMLISMGLSKAIRELCEAMESMYGVHFEFECEDPELPLSSDVSIILFKGIRELFFNVVKHAGVTRAVVSLKRRSKNLQLTVADEGRGFRAPIPGEMPLMGKGLGLLTIQEWLRDVGGRVEIESTPGSHTRITLWAPLDENW
jgi:PAS domain S-box-containing protein